LDLNFIGKGLFCWAKSLKNCALGKVDRKNSFFSFNEVVLEMKKCCSSLSANNLNWIFFERLFI